MVVSFNQKNDISKTYLDWMYGLGLIVTTIT